MPPPSLSQPENKRMAEMLQPFEAVGEIEPLLSHLWMVRTFLKHAEEIQDSLEMLEIPRTLFDVIRATEPALQAGDHARYIHKLRGKMNRLREARDYLVAQYSVYSDHTNYQMAARSLDAATKAIEAVLARCP
jgi:hypothetical protein